jgi:hypothetical protein
MVLRENQNIKILKRGVGIKMCKAMDFAQRINDVFLEAREENERLRNIVHETDLATCDKLHDIELSNVKGMYDAWEKILQLKKIRKTRREAKDELRLLKLIPDYQNLISDIDEEMKKMKKRQYNVRTDCKLTELDI